MAITERDVWVVAFDLFERDPEKPTAEFLPQDRHFRAALQYLLRIQEIMKTVERGW